MSFMLSQCASKPELNDKEITINTVSNVAVSTDYEMIISKVTADSRCPIGVSCIWAGQVELNVKVFQDKKEIEEKAIIVGPKDEEVTKAWFSKYITSGKKIKEIYIAPARDNQKELIFKEYTLKIVLE